MKTFSTTIQKAQQMAADGFKDGKERTTVKYKLKLKGKISQEEKNR